MFPKKSHRWLLLSKLIQIGDQKKVTNENKQEYIDLLVNFKFINRVKEQMDAFLAGFHDIIPQGEIDLFDPSELELLMCGLGMNY